MSRSSRAHRNPALALLLVLATALLAAVLSAAPAAAQYVLVARWVDAEGGEIARRGFDLAALDALDPIAIETTTPWTEGVGRFEGARLGALAALEPDAGEIAEARLTEPGLRGPRTTAAAATSRRAERVRVKLCKQIPTTYYPGYQLSW